MTHREIDTAIQRSFDGALAEAEALKLRAVLKSAPEARSLYYEYAGLHQALIYRLSRSSATDTAKSLARARLRLQTRRSARFAMVAAAAALVALGVALRMIFVPAPPPLATLKGSAGCLFTVQPANPEADPAPGELEKESTVHITQGTLELALDNGSRAIVLAPATFHLQSGKRMFLHRGTAWFRVPEEGHGFQVATPEMVVTDLGTEFGIHADPVRGDEVHVFSGKVHVRCLSALHGEETLSANRARRCDPVGRLDGTPLRPEEFLKELPAETAEGLIANGNFEAGNDPDPSRFGVFATAARLPGWSFGRNVVVGLKSAAGTPGYGEGDTTVVSSTADTQVAFRDDSSGRPAAEDVTIRQTFATVPGTTYTVTFEMGAIFFRPDALEVTASVAEGAVGDGGALLGQLVARRSAASGNGYNAPASFTFTATTTSATLAFTETSRNSVSADPVLDNVSVKVIR